MGKEEQEKGRGTAVKGRTCGDHGSVTRFPQKARLGCRIETLLPISACHASKPGRGPDMGPRTVASESAGTHAATGHCTQAQPRDTE